MSLWRLVFKEIAYRKMDFCLGALAITLAVGALVAVLTLLRAHEARANDMAAARKDETLALMREVEDDYRKITLKGGYNVLIFNREQDLAEFYAQGYATKTIPESHVNRLAASTLVTVQHLMPTLHQAITWPGREDLRVILIGVRSEVPLAHLNPKAPLWQPVEPGHMRLGYVAAQKLNVTPGAEVSLMGRTFRVSEIHPERGNTDDISVWLHLDDAQDMLGKDGEINAIMALSCHCEEATLEGIRGEIANVLPDTQLIQLASQAAVRTDARNRAAALNQETMAAEEDYHERLRRERETFAAWLAPVILLGAGAWVGLQALGNVRARRAEIGIWRALGFRSWQVLFIFLAKALLLGAGGAAAGYVLGFAAGVAWSAFEGVPYGEYGARVLFDVETFAGALLLAPLLSLLASWIPAQMAARHDPAVALRCD